jgi:hypothetical protein
LPSLLMLRIAHTLPILPRLPSLRTLTHRAAFFLCDNSAVTRPSSSARCQCKTSN